MISSKQVKEYRKAYPNAGMHEAKAALLEAETGRFRLALKHISQFTVVTNDYGQWIGAGALDVAREALEPVSEDRKQEEGRTEVEKAADAYSEPFDDVANRDVIARQAFLAGAAWARNAALKEAAEICDKSAEQWDRLQSEFDYLEKTLKDACLCLASIQTGGRIENEWINRILGPWNEREKKRTQSRQAGG